MNKIDKKDEIEREMNGESQHPTLTLFLTQIASA